MACRIWPDIASVPSTLGAQSRNHWTTREVQHWLFFFRCHSPLAFFFFSLSFATRFFLFSLQHWLLKNKKQFKQTIHRELQPQLTLNSRLLIILWTHIPSLPASPYHSLLQNTRKLTGPSNQRELAVGPNALTFTCALVHWAGFIAHLHCCKHCVLSCRWRLYSYLNEVPVEWILHTDHLVDNFKFLVKNFALLEVNLGDFFRALRAYRGPESQGLVLCKTGDSVRHKEWMSIHTRFSFLKEEVK